MVVVMLMLVVVMMEFVSLRFFCLFRSRILNFLDPGGGGGYVGEVEA